VGRVSRPSIVKKVKRTRVESGMTTGGDQRGKKLRQGELSENGGLKGDVHPSKVNKSGGGKTGEGEEEGTWGSKFSEEKITQKKERDMEDNTRRVR
jgi:hypothetical protein